MRQHTYSLLGIKLYSSIKRLGCQDELPISKRLCKLRLSMKSKKNNNNSTNLANNKDCKSRFTSKTTSNAQEGAG